MFCFFLGHVLGEAGHPGRTQVAAGELCSSQLVSYSPQRCFPRPSRMSCSLSCRLSTWMYTPLPSAWFCMDCLTKPSYELTPGVFVRPPFIALPLCGSSPFKALPPLSGAQPSLVTVKCLSCPQSHSPEKTAVAGYPTQAPAHPC